MILYMAVDVKNNELPLCVMDSVKELAEWAGLKPDTISCYISRGLEKKVIGIKFVKVIVED